jgi:hypothetical protein
MSAINIFTTPKAVHVVTDGAAYLSDGTMTAVVQKAHPIAHLRMVLAARGPSILTPLLAEAVQHAFQSFDEAAEGLGEVVEEAVETYSGLLARCSIGAGFDLMMAGWSEARDCPEVYGLSSIGQPGRPAWTLHKSGQVVFSPDDGAPLMKRLEPHAAKLSLHTNDPLDVALLMMEAQRHVCGVQGGDRPVYGVGAFAQATTVTRDGISSRILRRWADPIGVPLQPIPATHDEDGAALLPWYGEQDNAAPAPIAGRPALSREQQRRMKQMNRRAR